MSIKFCMPSHDDVARKQEVREFVEFVAEYLSHRFTTLTVEALVSYQEEYDRGIYNNELSGALAVAINSVIRHLEEHLGVENLQVQFCEHIMKLSNILQFVGDPNKIH